MQFDLFLQMKEESPANGDSSFEFEIFFCDYSSNLNYDLTTLQTKYKLYIVLKINIKRR